MAKSNVYAELSQLEAIEFPTEDEKKRINQLICIIDDIEYERRQIAYEDREWFGE